LVRALEGPRFDQYVDQFAMIEMVAGLLWIVIALTKTRSLQRENHYADAPLTKV
jgi:hypothetical protein